MKKQPNKRGVNAYFIVDDTLTLTIGTPKSISASDITLDIPFHELANNYDLQIKLHLASAALIRPAWNPPIAYPMKGKELIEYATGYFSSFEHNPKKSNKQRDYLINNGLVRILVIDEKLRGELKELIQNKK